MPDARPLRLPDGSWGAVTEDRGVEPGDVVTIRTREGKHWDSEVLEVVGLLVRTERAPPRRAREPEVMPCAVLGCGGTWTWRGEAIAPLREDRPAADRMCNRCREVLGQGPR